MQRLCRIELPEVAGVVGDEDQVVVARVARDVPILPAGPADMRDMPGFMAGPPGDGNQVNAEAFVDQKPHDTAMVSRQSSEKFAPFPLEAVPFRRVKGGRALDQG
jgi:hypothetical protein